MPTHTGEVTITCSLLKRRTAILDNVVLAALLNKSKVLGSATQKQGSVGDSWNARHTRFSETVGCSTAAAGFIDRCNVIGDFDEQKFPSKGTLPLPKHESVLQRECRDHDSCIGCAVTRIFLQKLQAQTRVHSLQLKCEWTTTMQNWPLLLHKLIMLPE